MAEGSIEKAEGITLRVRVIPRSSRRKIEGMVEGKLRIYLHAPPVGNAANQELIELISEKLKVPKGSVRILRGGCSRDKLLEIKGVTIEQVNSIIARGVDKIS